MPTLHYPHDWRQSDLTYVSSLVASFGQHLEEVPPEKESLEPFVQNSLESYLTRSAELLSRLEALLSELFHQEYDTPKAEQRLALQLQLTGQGLYTETIALKATLEEEEGQGGGTMGFSSSTPAGSKPKVRSWFKQLQAILKRILGGIWNFLRSSLALEAVKLKGGMGHGIPGIFNAEMEIEISD